MKLRSVKFAIAVLVVLCAVSAAAQERVECAAVRSAILRRSVRYCAILPPSYDREKSRKFPLVYYLHGLGESEQTLTGPLWNVIEDLQRSRIGEFLMVAPDGGRSFFINSRDGRFRYEDFLVREFIPAIERKYRASGSRAGRGIAGTSMGGYGALRLAFKYPHMFAAVTAEMPALYEKFPPQLADLVRLSGSGRQMGDLFGDPFDEAFWERNSPFTLARRHAAQLRGLKIYFDCGDQDDYGFDEGARRLDSLLTSLKVPHEAHIYPGRHDPSYIAAHIDEALEFQSRALTGK